jgi:hypothetical protein
VFGQYHADGVDGVMAVESIVHQAFGGAIRGRFVAERDLRLDDRMQCGVHRSVRQPNTRGAVIVPHQADALLFVQREPFFRVGCLIGIVILHGCLRAANGSGVLR